MGKRKKSSRKPGPTRKREPLDTVFTCLFCHHDKSVSVRIDRKEGLGQLNCKICGQKYQGKVNHLTEPVDIYSEWIDAADAAQREAGAGRSVASASRPRPTEALADASDED